MPFARKISVNLLAQKLLVKYCWNRHLVVAHDGGQALIRVRHDQQVLFVQLVVSVVDDVQQNG